ncbi:hypothetical protein BHM03_00001207, partial [Ensete ventricosum]
GDGQKLIPAETGGEEEGEERRGVWEWRGSRKRDNPSSEGSVFSVAAARGRREATKMLLWSLARNWYACLHSPSTRRRNRVIPRILMPPEISGETVGEVKAVADMHQRKAEMARNSDAFIALPG